MIAPVYGSAEWQRGKAHASFLALGLDCDCGQGKRANEPCCRGCVRIHEVHGADGCHACREGRERHLGYLAGEVAQRAAANAAPLARVLDAVVASVAVERPVRCDPEDPPARHCPSCHGDNYDHEGWCLELTRTDWRAESVPARGGA